MHSRISTALTVIKVSQSCATHWTHNNGLMQRVWNEGNPGWVRDDSWVLVRAPSTVRQQSVRERETRLVRLCKETLSSSRLLRLAGNLTQRPSRLYLSGLLFCFFVFCFWVFCFSLPRLLALLWAEPKQSPGGWRNGAANRALCQKGGRRLVPISNDGPWRLLSVAPQLEPGTLPSQCQCRLSLWHPATRSPSETAVRHVMSNFWEVMKQCPLFRTNVTLYNFLICSCLTSALTWWKNTRTIIHFVYPSIHIHTWHIMQNRCSCCICIKRRQRSR